MSVGSGNEKKMDVNNFADSLADTIDLYNPNKIVFFGSKISDKLIKKILQNCEKKEIVLSDGHDVVYFTDIDNFSKCYREICIVIDQYPDVKRKDIYIDYTSGTKTMVAAFTVAALLHNTKLTLTSGDRSDEDGSITAKTSKPQVQPLYEAYDKIHYENLKRDFNTYRFDSALECMGKIVNCKQKPILNYFITSYKKWDLMEWKDAIELLRDANFNKKSYEQVANNKKFLEELVTCNSNCNSSPDNTITANIMILSDLLNNANRRIAEGKYDDAVARLYRATELIAQILLFKRDLDTINDNLFLDDIKKQTTDKKILDRYERKIQRDEKTHIKRQDGKIATESMGMREKFYLLRDLNDPCCKTFFDGALNSDMNTRNKSILAHGLSPVGKDTAERIYNSVLEYSREIFSKGIIDDLMQKATFPIL
jgi:CRISPR-associated protein (TIGR02710 family)